MADTEAVVVPLLPSSGTSQGRAGSVRASPSVMLDMEEEDPDLEEAGEEDKALFADHKQRGTSLVWNDAVLLLVHIVQVFAVLQGLALRWPFPAEWVKATHFTFLLNLDVWDFAKVQKNGTYKEVQNYFTPSASMPFSYWHLMLAWGIVMLVAVVSFVVTYLVITYRKHPLMMVKSANLQRVYVVMLQVLCLPLGTAMARVFHCTDNGVMEVDNTVPCYVNGLHWAYICPCVTMAILLYGLFPIWMIVHTRAELLNLTTDRHEGYLQLKEVEYVQGLDMLYVIGRFHMFASFRKLGAHLRAQLFIFSFCILLVVTLTFRHILVGVLVITCLFLIILMASLVVRPFRVTCFNLQLSFSYLCLLAFCLMGSLRASFDSNSLASAWLTPAYLNLLLTLIVLTWFGVTVAFLVYLVVRHQGFWSSCCPRPLWPSMMSDDLNKLSPETRKYVRAIVRCRKLVEMSLSMSPMFAPAHELSRQIHVMNAFCREAEHLADPIHDTLWDVLDELLEAHSQIAPRSLFAESVKDSIRQTAAELLKLMPKMVRRLAQREYDFILVSPVKRRLLFKMYCMGVFLNGRREKVERQKLTLPAIERVFRSTRHDPEYEQDDGYYEDMYPDVEETHLHRPNTAMSLGLFSNAGLDDDLALEEAEEWTRHHPVSASGIRNRGYEDDVSAILRDNLSDSVSAMMDSVPSTSRSVSRMSTPGSAHPLHTRLVVVDRPGSASRPTSRLTVTEATKQDIERISSPGHPLPTSPLAGLPGSRPGSDHLGSRPGSGHPGSRPGLDQPGSRPGSGQPRTRPGSSPGSRPGSAGRVITLTPGSRPDSANSGVQAESQWRQSPLPGQVHVERPPEGGQEAALGDGPVHSLSVGAPGQSDA